MVAYIRSDLDFILDADQDFERRMQRGSAAVRAAGGASIPAYNLSLGLRTVDGSYNHLLPGQEQWGAADNQFPSLMDPVFRPADGTPFDPDGPGPAPAMPTAPELQPLERSQLARFRLEPAHHLQPAGRPDAGQSGGRPDGPGERRLGERDGRSRRSQFHLPGLQAGLDAEYQARVVMQNAKAAAEALGDGNPATPPTPKSRRPSTHGTPRPRPTPPP